MLRLGLRHVDNQANHIKERNTLSKMILEIQLAIKCAVLPPAQAARSWNQLMQMVTFEKLSHSSQRILPKIFKNLEPYTDLPFYEKLMGSYKFNWVKNNKILMPFIPIISEINTQCIDYRLLKGAALNLTSNSMGERVMGDIDLLIKTKDLNQIVKILKSRGYIQKYATQCPNVAPDIVEHELCFVSPENVEVDVHLVEKSFPKLLFKEMMDTPPVELIFNGIKAKLPSKELALIHSAKHGQQSVGETDSIQSYVDINQLMNEIDFRKLQNKSNKTELNEIVNVYLKTLNQLTNHKYPSIKDGRKNPLKLTKLNFNFFNNDRTFSHLQEIIKMRQISKQEIKKISKSFKGRRLLYMIWIKLGKPRHLERFAFQLLGGFLATPSEYFQPGNSKNGFESSVQKWIVMNQVSLEAHDWRFKLKRSKESERTLIELTSERFKNWNWLVFVNGELQGTTIQNKDGAHILSTRKHSKILEISLRSPSHVCELCEHGLSDLRIRILG